MNLFDEISSWPSLHARHETAPLLPEREQYLATMLKRGVSRIVVRSTASYLIHIVRLLRMTSLRKVELNEIEAAGAIGGNVGDVRATFQKAIANICGMTQGSSSGALLRLCDSAVGRGCCRKRFVNACIEIDTSLDPHALLFTLQKIETIIWAAIAPKKRRWGPRTLDLDLIAYDDVSMQKPELTLPHPRLFERAFVLVPLAEISPDRVIVRPQRHRSAGGAIHRGN